MIIIRKLVVKDYGFSGFTKLFGITKILMILSNRE